MRFHEDGELETNAFRGHAKGSAICLIHRVNSLIRESNSLIRTEQGIVHSALELQYK